MKKSLIGIALLSLFSVTAQSFAQPGVSGKQPYIVVFKDNAPFHQFSAMAATADARVKADPQGWGKLDVGVLGAVQRFERAHGHQFKARKAYSHAIKGFAAELTPEQIETLKSDPTIAYVEKDKKVRINAQEVPWGVAHTIGAYYTGNYLGGSALAAAITADGLEKNKRIVQYPMTGATSFFWYNNIQYGSNGKQTVVYVIDSGIAPHPDLNVVGRKDFTDQNNNTDCTGHGTHVAGTIGAKHDTAGVVGTAPGVKLFALKVFDCSGYGSYSDIIDAVNHVTANGSKPGVVNMSLGGQVSRAVNDAVRTSAAAGYTYVLAAGNSNADACNFSPASASIGTDGNPVNNIITVGALDQFNSKASFRNFGKCVTMWAPGVGINSTYLNGGFIVFRGTSMAAPHVAGLAALARSQSKWYGYAETRQKLLGLSENVGSYAGYPVLRARY